MPSDLAVPLDEARRHPSTADRLVWLLVAMAPLLFALACWSPGGAAGGQQLLLAYSLPISAIELSIFAYAVSAGLTLREALARAPRWAQLALGLVVAIAIVTAQLAANPLHSTIRTAQLLIHLLFGFGAWHLLQTRWAPLRAQVWPGIVVGTCLYLAAVVAWVIAVQDRPDFDWKRFALGVVHIRQTGFYSAAGAAAAIGLAAATTRRGYWLAVAAASLLTALSFWSGTRGSLFAVLAAFAAGLVLLPALRTLRMAGAMIVSTAAGALLSLVHSAPHPYYGLLRISQSAAATGADEIATGRLGMWRAALEAVRERPLFGYGESQFGVAVPGWSQFNHPHNIFVQVLVQWGIVGFLCYFSLAAFVAWRFVLAVRRGGPDMVAPFLVAGALFAMSLYEGALYHPYPIMMIVLSVAFVLARPDHRGVAGWLR